MLQKIWERHEVLPETSDRPAVLYVDLHLVHEVSSPQAFTQLRERGLPVRRPDRTLATMDHSTPTRTDEVMGRIPFAIESAGLQLRQLQDNCGAFGVELLDLQHPGRGIVHVIGPELGLTHPGSTVVCGDSHTSTHGAFGALAFGIGTTEVGHVLATQCLLQRRPRTLAVEVDGRLAPAVSAKDLILTIIGELGVAGGTGSVIEYRGSAVRALSMEQRMTLCNMSIEAGARAGLIAPDEVTFEWLEGRPRAPKGTAWTQALAQWRSLASDAGARFDRTVTLDGSRVQPMITYGTNPSMAMPVNGTIPSRPGDVVFERALAYMGLRAGDTLRDRRVDVVFIGSCTNGRLEDLRAAAGALRGQRIARGVQMLVVPGSQAVKRAAEAEGLDELFIRAGAEWRESGCSMCIGMNGDTVGRDRYCVSTSNRNFEGRQGPGARTLLASPLTAAASALRGYVTDPRELSNG